MLVSAISLTIMSSLVRIISYDMPSIEIIFFRNSIGVILIGLSFLKYPLKQVGGKPFLLLFRSIIGVLAMLMLFHNIATINFANAITYSRLSPVFTALFALWFLKEKIRFNGWLAIFLGLTGMLLVMQPDGLMLESGHIFGLLNAIFAALAFTSIRELKKYYDTKIIVFSFMSMGVFITGISMIISNFYTNKSLDFIMGKFVMPSNSNWLYLIAIGIFASLGQIYLTKAYGATKAGIVGAIGYSIIVFSVIIGYFLGDGLPNLLGFIGIVIIILGGLLVAWEKNDNLGVGKKDVNGN
jgi:drug/metabolite transporter (DMT)-like permease